MATFLREIPYKTVDGRTLRLHVSSAPSLAGAGRPVAVFFHGGGWVTGDWTQFRPQAARLNALGLIAVLVEYRLDGPGPASEDAVDALNAVVEHAADVGCDPSRIVAIGGSAGAHLALATAVLDLPNTDPSRRPAALALLNPVTNTTGDFPAGFGRRWFADDEQAERYSPLHHVSRDVPPTLVMHGTADTAVHHESSAAFVDAVNGRGGGPAELVLYPGQPHGFFNPRGSDDVHFELTTREIIRFLQASLTLPTR